MKARCHGDDDDGGGGGKQLLTLTLISRPDIPRHTQLEIFPSL